MLIKKLYLIFIFLCLFNNTAKTQEIIIISKIENQIITNVDIEIEKKYLLLLNNNLNKLSKKDFFNLAKNSLIREKIKNKEVNKIFDKVNEEADNKIIKNFYIRLGFNEKNKFIEYLVSKNISYEELKKKLILETLWNQLIYRKFNNQIRIDENSIKKQITEYYNSKDKKYAYNLSEIVIDIDKNISSKQKEIVEYVEEYGFKIAANKYSKSNTSIYGGEIGWIKSARLSANIKKKISKIKIGEITNPIQTSNGYLFLKLNDKKEVKEDYDLEKELKQQIRFEKNRQLNQFSLNYYKKLKKNIIIYENK